MTDLNELKNICFFSSFSTAPHRNYKMAGAQTFDFLNVEQIRTHSYGSDTKNVKLYNSFNEVCIVSTFNVIQFNIVGIT